MTEQTKQPGFLASYWAYAADGQFVIPACTDCQHHFLPPRLYCPQCGSEQLSWEPSRGLGVVYSYTVVEKGPGRQFADQAPYVIALAELDELSPGSRFFGRLVDIDPTRVQVGQRVAVETRTLGDGDPVPVLVPVEVVK